jgi:hypothetical protein
MADDEALCRNCGNDVVELFTQADLGAEGQLITCLVCDECANADLWHERLLAILDGATDQDDLSESLMAQAQEFVREVQAEDVLPVCFQVKCTCGRDDFRNITDEDGLSTLPHVKVCTHCYQVTGVDDHVLMEDLLEMLRTANYRTTACRSCGNTNPYRYRFEEHNGDRVIRCMQCQTIVEASAPEDAVEIAHCEDLGGACGGIDPADAATKVLSLGATVLEKYSKGPGKMAGLVTLICVDLASLARRIQTLNEEARTGQIHRSAYVDGVVEAVGQTATRALVAGACCLLPITPGVGMVLGVCLGALLAPAGGRLFVWLKDQSQKLKKKFGH